MPDDSAAASPSTVSMEMDNSQQTQQTETDPNNSSTEEGSKSASSFVSALDQENRDYFTKKGWKDDPNAVIKSYRELEKMQSKGSSQQTQQNQQQTQSEVPATASEYTFKLPEGIPAEGFYDNKTADAFKGWAHKAKLSPEQAQALHDEFVKYTFESYTGVQTEQTTTLNNRLQSAHDSLTKEWGQAGTPQFTRNLEMARRAVTHLDPDLRQALKDHGVLIDQKGQDGKSTEVVANAAIMKALAKAGSAMFVEDNMFGKRPLDENPFDPKFAGPDAMKRQGEIIKQDRELAKTMIRAAGVEGDWPHMFR